MHSSTPTQRFPRSPQLLSSYAHTEPDNKNLGIFLTTCLAAYFLYGGTLSELEFLNF
jgi:hypothetical protein